MSGISTQKLGMPKLVGAQNCLWILTQFSVYCMLLQLNVYLSTSTLIKMGCKYNYSKYIVISINKYYDLIYMYFTIYSLKTHYKMEDI